jgi:hypothetical protein
MRELTRQAWLALAKARGHPLALSLSPRMVFRIFGSVDGCGRLRGERCGHGPLKLTMPKRHEPAT